MRIIANIFLKLGFLPLLYLFGVTIRFFYDHYGLIWSIVFVFLFFQIYYRCHIASWSNRHIMNLIGLLFGPCLYIVWSSILVEFPERDFGVLILSVVLFITGEFLSYLYHKKRGTEWLLKQKDIDNYLY